MGLEIHTEILAPPHPFGFSTAIVRRDARPVEGAPGVWVASPVHALVHASIHFAWGHTLGFGACKTLRDVHGLTGAGDIDGDEMVRTACASSSAACVYWTLRLARDWADVPVDPRTLEALSPPGPERLHRVLARHVGCRLAPRESDHVPLALARGLWETAMRPSSQGWGTSRPWGDVGNWARPGDRPDVEPRPNGAVRAAAAARYLSRLAVD